MKKKLKHPIQVRLLLPWILILMAIGCVFVPIRTMDLIGMMAKILKEKGYAI